ncbi:type 1 glutamine amidotransferase [Isoptericola variabilis]|uniref:Glutamine amidotransferase class-I n=1 Tax=Isoptericola variabilis (strain 225) TaxID=743718 RepID=F6FTE1_ISOV2|nr:type 1 glutamine amidotransferase [Isoptericola variabilis]AEG45305.1 glutamine amidotransferase class-I [Isoptericola variabilis 225]TWH34808.1 GMP synthase (glutamine-hydrolysing) [Isoptericola variabilis J7]
MTVLQHSSDVPLDRLARRLGDVRLVRLFDGDPVPALDECGDGLVVLGGQMSAYADDVAPWLPAVRALLAEAATSGLPTLGICLGAQLLAVAGGGRVEVGAPPGREAGVVPVRWRGSALTDPVLGPLVRAAGATTDADVEAGRCSTLAVSMHADAVVELPVGAEWLAYSEMYPYQAFRLGSALGVQFHPEASPSLAVRWALDHTDVSTAEVSDAAYAHSEELDATCALLADAFMAQVRAHAGAGLALAG